ELTTELSGRFVIGGRVTAFVLFADEGDDAGVADECK
ncbi:unnamed protein product, partial [Rotaria magnacalcarata]